MEVWDITTTFNQYVDSGIGPARFDETNKYSLFTAHLDYAAMKRSSSNSSATLEESVFFDLMT